MRTPKQTIIDALNNHRGDDLYRAKRQFGWMKDEELDREYGDSGKTCREIVRGYEEHAAEVDAALALANSLP
jgi:hypothetical protein